MVPVCSAPANVGAHPRHRATGRALVAVAALCAVLLLSGCQISQDAAKKDPFLQELLNAQNAQSAQNQENAASATQSNGTAHRLGTPFQVNNTVWTIQSASAAFSIKLGGTIYTAKGEYIVVRFLFQNISDSQQPPLPDMLVIQSGSGKSVRTYLPDTHVTALYAAQVHQPDFLTVTTLTNQTYHLALVFDVPRNLTGLSLQFHSYPVQNQNDINI